MSRVWQHDFRGAPAGRVGSGFVLSLTKMSKQLPEFGSNILKKFFQLQQEIVMGNPVFLVTTISADSMDLKSDINVLVFQYFELRSARPGELNSLNTQAPTWFRQHLRQGRRLNTMVCLLRARGRNPTEENKQSCDKLWKAICLAEGFRGKFPKWCVLNLGCPFPQLFPALEQCLEIASVSKTISQGLMLKLSPWN